MEDVAGAKRIVQLLGDPVNTLKRINLYIECALRRLYRLRNLVAHGGRTDSIVLEAGVRAVSSIGRGCIRPDSIMPTHRNVSVQSS